MVIAESEDDLRFSGMVDENMVKRNEIVSKCCVQVLCSWTSDRLYYMNDDIL